MTASKEPRLSDKTDPSLGSRNLMTFDGVREYASSRNTRKRLCIRAGSAKPSVAICTACGSWSPAQTDAAASSDDTPPVRIFTSSATRAIVPLPQHGSKTRSPTASRTHRFTKSRAKELGVAYCPRTLRRATSTVDCRMSASCCWSTEPTRRSPSNWLNCWSCFHDSAGISRSPILSEKMGQKSHSRDKRRNASSAW